MIKVVKKGIVLPLLLLILASVTIILGALFIFFQKQKATNQKVSNTASLSPSPADEAAGWKIFIGSTVEPEIKHSYKYPTNLEEAKVPGLLSKGVATKTENIILNNQITAEEQLSSTNSPGDFTAFASLLNLENVTDLPKENRTGIVNVSSVKEVSLGGKTSVRVFGEDKNSNRVSRIQYMVDNLNISGIDNKWGFAFDCYFITKNGAALEKLCDQIASTFKFIDDTSNWKTYTNTDWSFSIKYPSDWLKGEPGDMYSDIKSFYTIFGPATTENHYGEKIPPTATPSVTIQIVKTNKNDLEKAVQDFNPCIYEEANLRKSINIGGQSAFLFEGESLCGLGNPRDVTYVMNGENLYEITVNYNIETTQILSTFKFIE